MWVSEGVLPNPSAGDILADTGALPIETKPFTVVSWTDAGDAEIEVAVRNAGDSADISVQRIRVQTTPVFGMPITLGLNQRIVARLRVNLTGNIQVSILG